ncbi:MAG: SDR family oxidoreductase [Christensenella sp.]
MPKTAIVTGASRGIGAAIARELAKNGFAVVINYNKSESAAQKLAAEICEAGGEAVCFKADVSLSDEAKMLSDFTADRYKRIDLLVNNAGISHFSLATDTTDEEWQQVFDVNTKSVFYMCRAVLPIMIWRKSGSIINIGSMWGEVGAACETAYSASKAAVIGYTKALAKEVGPSGIAVNCISPGLIDTDMNLSLSESDKRAVIDETPFMRIGTPEDIARLALYLSGDSFMTGQVLGVNGGLII